MILLVSGVVKVKTITKEKVRLLRLIFFLMGIFILLFDFHMLYDVLF
jgi:hypothetical protein